MVPCSYIYDNNKLFISFLSPANPNNDLTTYFTLCVFEYDPSTGNKISYDNVSLQYNGDGNKVLSDFGTYVDLPRFTEGSEVIYPNSASGDCDYRSYSLEQNLANGAISIYQMINNGFFSTRMNKINYVLIKNLSSSGSYTLTPGNNIFANFESIMLSKNQAIEVSVFKDIAIASSIINL